MKRAIGIAVFAIMLIATTGAHAATQIGVRGGWSHASGNIFEGSGNVGGGGIYGVVVSMGLFPAVDVEFAYERYTNDFDFEKAAYQDVFFGGEGTPIHQHSFRQGGDKGEFPFGGEFQGVGYRHLGLFSSGRG